MVPPDAQSGASQLLWFWLPAVPVTPLTGFFSAIGQVVGADAAEHKFSLKFCYRPNHGPSNSHGEALTPSVAMFGDRAFQEVIKAEVVRRGL